MKLTITIPKPCHENWNAMHAHDGGRFCDSCQHTVADLTRATDAELVALFASDAKPKCARFDPAQLDRVLGAEQAPRSGALPIAAFTTLAAVASGCESIGQQPPMTTVGEMEIMPMTMSAMPPDSLSAALEPADSRPSCKQILGDTLIVPQEMEFRTGQMIAVEGIVLEDPPLPEVELPAHTVEAPHMKEVITVTVGRLIVKTQAQIDRVEICGLVVDEGGEPLPFAEIRLSDRSISTYADSAGAFRMEVPVDAQAPTTSLVFQAQGYMPSSRSFELPVDHPEPAPEKARINAAPSVAIDPKDPLGIIGSVEDGSTGRMMPDAIVSVVGTDVRVRCDERGRFGLRIPEALKAKPIALEIMAENAGRMVQALSPYAVPCCVPMRFKPEPTPEPESKRPCHDLGVIQLNERRYLLGDVQIIRKPSTSERVTAPVKKAWHKLTR